MDALKIVLILGAVVLAGLVFFCTLDSHVIMVYTLI